MGGGLEEGSVGVEFHKGLVDQNSVLFEVKKCMCFFTRKKCRNVFQKETPKSMQKLLFPALEPVLETFKKIVENRGPLESQNRAKV